MKDTFTFRVADDLRKSLQKIATKDDRTLGYLIRKAIKQFIKNHERTDGSTDSK